MKRNQAVAVLLISMVILSVGLIFLCAAMREPSRFALAIILLVLGGGLAIGSGLQLRRVRDLDPENLSDEITALARGGGANEVTLSQVVAELGVPDEAALAALDLLV